MNAIRSSEGGPDLPKDAAEHLRRLSDDPSFAGVIPHDHVQRLLELTGYTIDRLALALVPFATEYALPPISDFKVGAVGLGGTTGALYYGANLEFPGVALSFCVHAEQSVVTNAWMNGEQSLPMLAISAAPCGYCRQFLYETGSADKMEVVLADEATPLVTLLPDAFGPSDLGVKTALLEPQWQALSCDASDEVAKAALDAACRSYVPYSLTYSGVAAVTTNGAIYQGRYAENAAYNPSMSPLEGALAMWNLAGDRMDPVVRVALVEVAGQASQLTATEIVLKALDISAFDHYTATVEPS